MDEIIKSLPFIIGALLAVTFIDTAGAVASRKLNFNFGYLTPFSLTVYTLLGYFVGGVAALNMVFLASLFVGFYDATVGWKLSKLCKPKIMIPKEIEDKLTYSYSLMVMLILSPVFSFIGYAVR